MFSQNLSPTSLLIHHLKEKTILIRGACNMDITIETDTEETQIVVVDRGTPGIEDSGATIVEDPETTALPEP